MKKHNVFYAWQSDHPSGICRSFIRRALDKVARQLAQDATVQDAPRDVLVAVDTDTRGIPGSPPVAETILAKIADCDSFVADLTSMPTATGLRASPNPNVLLEYGYALATLGDRRVVAVMNDAFGSPEKLPFDIRHRRWPIRYTLAPDATDVDRERARATMVRELRGALTQILQTPPSVPDAPSPASDKIQARNLWAMSSYVQPEDGDRVGITYGPSATIEIAPADLAPPRLSYAAMNVAAAGFIPPAANEGEGSTGRIHRGVVRFTLQADGTTVRAASAVTDDSRLHSIDFALLGEEIGGKRVVPVAAIEDLLFGAFSNLIDVADRHLKLTPPLHAWVRLTGISDFMLAVDPSMYDRDTLGPILSGRVAREFRIASFDEDPDTLLGPLFDDLYDEAGGYARPAKG